VAKVRHLVPTETGDIEVDVFEALWREWSPQ